MSNLRSSGLSISSALVSRASTYVVLIIMARMLPPEDFGAYTVAMVGVTVLSAIVSGGGDMWLNRFTHSPASYRILSRVYGAYLALALLFAAVLGVLGLVSAWVAEIVVGQGLLVASSVILGIVSGLAETVFAMVRSQGRLSIFFGLRDFVAPVAVVLSLLAVQPESATLAQMVQLMVWLVVLLVALALFRYWGQALPRLVLPGRKMWRGLAHHTLGLMYGNLGSRLAAAVDLLVISWFISLADVGEYRVAAQFANGFAIVQHFLFLGLPWQMRGLGRTGQPGPGLPHVVARQRLLVVLGLIALLGLCGGAELVLGLLGQRFTEAVPLFRIFVLIRFVDLLWGPQHEILVSNGLVTADAHSNVVALAVWPLVYFGLNCLVSPIQAALVAVGVAALARQFFRYRLMRNLDFPMVTGGSFGMYSAIVVSTAAAVAGLLA